LVRQQVKDQLIALGYEVAGPVGQSDFKCSLAVRKKGEDGEYALAILIDDEGHYRNGNRIEQYFLRPAILRSFGWKVLPVYAKDWLHQPQKVMEQIGKILGHKNAVAAPAGSSGGPEGWDHLSFRRLVHPADEVCWEGATDGNQLILRWGRTGTRGQTRLRTFADGASALQELDRLENEQKEKGFQEPQEPR
jgi:predicted DNA-binding WGR domain protein